MLSVWQLDVSFRGVWLQAPFQFPSILAVASALAYAPLVFLCSQTDGAPEWGWHHHEDIFLLMSILVLQVFHFSWMSSDVSTALFVAFNLHALGYVS